jgi:hypothetical protein
MDPANTSKALDELSLVKKMRWSRLADEFSSLATSSLTEICQVIALELLDKEVIQDSKESADRLITVVHLILSSFSSALYCQDHKILDNAIDAIIPYYQANSLLPSRATEDLVGQILNLAKIEVSTLFLSMSETAKSDPEYASLKQFADLTFQNAIFHVAVYGQSASSKQEESKKISLRYGSIIPSSVTLTWAPFVEVPHYLHSSYLFQVPAQSAVIISIFFLAGLPLKVSGSGLMALIAGVLFCIILRGVPSQNATSDK